MVLAGAQERPRTVIRTTTRLVQIRVMAMDRHGVAVTSLRKDDLQLLDNRKPQPIDFLTFEGGAAGPAATAPSADVRDDYAVILLDWLNPSRGDRLRVRDEVYKLLKTFRPRQQVALYLLSHTNPGLLHDFTDEPDELFDTLDNVEEEPEDPFDPSKPALTDPRYKIWVTLTVSERMASFNKRVLETIGVLGKLADRLSRLPGRKSVLWVTNGFPIRIDSHAVPGAVGGDAISHRAATEAVIGKLNRSNVAPYTVDARGLFPSSGYGNTETLGELSERTGGLSFADRNDLAECGVHEIQLKTKRAGVVLRYRESYQFSDGR